MTLVELVTPVLLFAAALHRKISRNMPPDYGEAKREALSLFTDIESRAKGLSMIEPWNRAKTPLVYLLDEIAIMSAWPGRDLWNNNSLEVEFLGHDEKMRGDWFYDREYPTAIERGDAEMIEILYTCLCLGFEGRLRGQSVELQNHAENLYARLAIPGRNPNDDQRLFPDAYKVDKSKRDSKAPMRIATVVLVLLGISISYFVVNHFVYERCIRELRGIVGAVGIEEQHAGTE